MCAVVPARVQVRWSRAPSPASAHRLMPLRQLATTCTQPMCRAMVGQEHVVSGSPMSVLLTENMLHFKGIGEGVKIADLNGHLLLYSKDMRRIGRDYEVVYDAKTHQPVATLQKKMLTMHEHSWKVFTGESTDDANLVATMQPAHMNIIGKHVRLLRPEQKDPFLSVKGNWRDKNFTYTTADGHVVAKTIVQGRFSGVVNFMTGNDSYILTVEPGGDLAFLTTCTIALNDILHPDME